MDLPARRADSGPLAPLARPRRVVDDGAHFDVAIIGSGFGGSVSALRLAEKGYAVVVLEKGRRWAPGEFPRTNWNVKRWMWAPAFGWRGIFKMTFFRHVTILSGVGVGGGSLVYANTLPTPTDNFFEASSWAHLGDWKAELAPHYAAARRMLGATKHGIVAKGDQVLKEIAADLGRSEHFGANDVAVYFGKPGQTEPDPYFGGKGPARTGCILCGGCMTGCRHGAKNTLDRNYLHLAEGLGAVVQPDTLVRAVRPRPEGGYRVEGRLRLGPLRRQRLTLTADRVVFAGGVLGSVDLLLRMRDDPQGLPDLSPRLGDGVRTNSESLTAVITPRRDVELDKGIAISSILHTDEHSHIEPVRYARGSGFFRLLLAPHAPGRSALARVAGAIGAVMRQPLRWMKALLVPDLSKHSQILLYMRTLDGTLRLRRRRGPFGGGMATAASTGAPPTSFIPEATDIAQRFADKLDGVPVSLATETLMGIPTTAHILGGCCMGETAEEGVIDTQHRVFGYDGLYVADGSAVSANPGVNPSLTITALAERAMSFIEPKGEPPTAIEPQGEAPTALGPPPP